MKKSNELPGVGKDEMNLVEFPITLLAKRHPSESNTLEFTDTIEGEHGKPVKREWTVSGSDKYGLPLAIDNDLLLALLAIGKEKNFDERKIHFSRYKLCKLMHWDIDGRSYKRIEEILDRLTGVKIKAKNGFWDNERKSYVTKHFGIIDSYELMDSSKPGHPGQETFSFSYVNLGEELFESIQAGYIKSLDMKTYFALESAITKRLYRYLDKKAYGKNKFEINLYTLAYTHLGFDEETYKYASLIKNKLTPAHDELIGKGFLKSAEYQKTTDGSSEKVVYMFIQPKAEPIEETPTAEPGREPASLGEQLLIRLTNIGVTRKVAEQILREYSLETVQSQIDALPHRKAEDAPAALVSSIMHGWSLPASYRKRRQRHAQAEAEKRQQEQEIKQKADHRARIEQYLSALSGDELAAITCHARECAQQEGGALFRGRGIPEYMVTGYLHILAEKRLQEETCAHRN